MGHKAHVTQAVTRGLNSDAPMKPSGIDWIGDIPAHWEVLPLNRIIRMQSGDYIAASDIKADGNHLVFGGNGVRGSAEYFNTIGPMVLIGRQGAQCGNVHVAHGKVWISEHAIRCIPEKSVERQWLAYILDTMNLNQYSVSAAQPGLSVDNLKHLQTTLPPLDTQQQIARFLDEKTAKIDRLIEKKRELLDRLAEKRQALITQAVTRGLNSDAPMKPSGISARMGDRRPAEGAAGMSTTVHKARVAHASLPEGWTCCRLQFIARLNPKKSSLEMEPDELVSFVPMNAVGEYGGLNLDELQELQYVYDSYTYFADGDICVAKITPSFENGKGALASGLTNGTGFGTTELHVLRPGPNIDQSFLFYVSIADDFRQLGESEMYGAAGQKRIDESFVKNWVVPLPPPDTQGRIVQFLDDKTARTDELIEKICESIACLKEYRSALITSAVTGQLLELR